MEEEQLLRLCHLCGHLNEGQKEVLRCEKCAKSFLPLTSFCELLKRIGGGGQGSQGVSIISKEDRSTLLLSIPIAGLVVYW